MDPEPRAGLPDRTPDLVLLPGWMWRPSPRLPPGRGCAAAGLLWQLLNGVQGGLAQDLARQGAQTVLEDPGEEPESAREVLLLDAPYPFDVSVERAF